MKDAEWTMKQLAAQGGDITQLAKQLQKANRFSFDNPAEGSNDDLYNRLLTDLVSAHDDGVSIPGVKEDIELRRKFGYLWMRTAQRGLGAAVVENVLGIFVEEQEADHAGASAALAPIRGIKGIFKKNIGEAVAGGPLGVKGLHDITSAFASGFDPAQIAKALPRAIASDLSSK